MGLSRAQAVEHVVILLTIVVSSTQHTEVSHHLRSHDWFDIFHGEWSTRLSEQSVGSVGDIQDQDHQCLNMLLVIIDDMRADLATFGHEDAPPTPNINKFADSARVFRRAYAQFPDCAPSRSSFLTGLRPDRLGIDSHECTTHTPDPSYKCHFRESLPETVSMPQYFKEAGYITLSYGKVFHQGLDDDQSWSSQEEFNDGYIRENNSAFKNKKWEYEQWFDSMNRGCSPGNHTSHCYTEEHSYTTPFNKFIDHKTTTQAIQSLSKLRNEFKPWFMAVGLVRPHLPFVCPGTFWDINHDPYENLTYNRNSTISFETHFGYGISHALMELKNKAFHGFGEFRDFIPKQLRDLKTFAKKETYVDQGVTHAVEQLKSDTRRGYRSCISFVDYEFGRMLSALSESDQENNTVVVLMSDHGFKLGEFDMWGKHSTLHMDVHVPLLIRHPNMKLPGKQEYQVVELVDVFPTLAELSGVSTKHPLPKVLDGQSLALLVIDPLHAPRLAKQISITQYLPFLNFKQCMAYSVIGREYILKRWTPCSHIPKCSFRMLDSVDLHRVQFNRQHKAIPFSLEHGHNLVKFSYHNNLEKRKLLSFASSSSSHDILAQMKEHHHRHHHHSSASSSSSLTTSSSLTSLAAKSQLNPRSLKWVFPHNVSHDIESTMKMIAVWARDQSNRIVTDGRNQTST